jgi:riboflavin kinase / FMN adenylyltransferase
MDEGQAGRRDRGERVVATIGVFDGVHRGHRALLARVAESARREGCRAVAVTFDPPPEEVLAPESVPARLTLPDRKRELLENAGIDRVHIVPFTPAVARMPADAFVTRVLLDAFDLGGLVIGYDFRFGAQGRGDAATLRAIGAGHAFWVEEVEAVLDGGLPISSTRIRALVREGNVAEAARLMARPYALEGRVVRGRGIGGQRLVPTANLDPDPRQPVPGEGVYVIEVLIGTQRHPGVASIGTSPTVAPSAQRLVEAHLLDFSGDLYGQRLVVEFHERLRGQQRFSGLEELKVAIGKDIARARIWLSGRGENRLAAL